jgi:hypothetical protein
MIEGPLYSISQSLERQRAEYMAGIEVFLRIELNTIASRGEQPHSANGKIIPLKNAEGLNTALQMEFHK